MKRYNLGIAGKVYLSTLLVLLVAFVLTTVSSWVLAGNQARIQADNQVGAALHTIQAYLNEETRELTTLGKWLVDQSNLVQMVRERDGDALTRYVQPWTQAGLVDSLIVVDSGGQVLARVVVDQGPSRGDSVLGSAGVREALQGQASSGIEQDPFGRLQSRIVLPVYGDRQSSPIGALIAAFFLDGDFVTHAAREGTQQIAIVYQNRIFISNLPDGTDKTVAGVAAPAEVVAAERAGRSSGPVLFRTSRDEYLFQFSPLQSPDQTTAGMIGVGVSMSVVREQQTAGFQALGIGLLASLAAAVLIGFLLTRSLVSRIGALQAAAESMAKGDLSSSIAIRGRDELGTLSAQMETLRQRLRQTVDASTTEKCRFEAAIDSMGVAAVITDREQHVVVANQAAERILREKRPALVGRPWEELFQDSGAATAMTVTVAAPDDGGGPPRMASSGRLRLADRPAVLLDIISSPIHIDGEAAGFVHVLQDASTQDRLLQAKDEFMLNVAHELRGPLASLRSFIDLLNEDYGSLPRRDSRLMLQALHRAVVRFQRLVENLIDIGSIQAGQFRVRSTPTSLRPLIDDAVSQVEPLLRGSDQRLQVGPVPSPCVVIADAPRVTQVLVNLLTNASKYSPEGQEITLTACEEGNWVRLEVIDHGAGIPESEQLEIFDRFYRTKRAQEEGIGIGLGLALARAIVEGHGGRIGVRSQIGRGSAFWFTLPRVSED